MTLESLLASLKRFTRPTDKKTPDGERRGLFDQLEIARARQIEEEGAPPKPVPASAAHQTIDLVAGPIFEAAQMEAAAARAETAAAEEKVTALLADLARERGRVVELQNQIDAMNHDTVVAQITGERDQARADHARAERNVKLLEGHFAKRGTPHSAAIPTEGQERPGTPREMILEEIRTTTDPEKRGRLANSLRNLNS